MWEGFCVELKENWGAAANWVEEDWGGFCVELKENRGAAANCVDVGWEVGLEVEIVGVEVTNRCGEVV